MGRTMKITDVTTYHLPGTRYPWVFLRIDTDSGLHGIGQVSSGPNSARGMSERAAQAIQIT